jgi:MerR family transcriptional regulator, copper efflux regulator
MLLISQLANEANVHLETIRYYERRGLLPAPPRRPSGYREYGPDSVARVRFIKSAQELGFSLVEIEILLALRVNADTNCDAVRKQAETKLAEINQKIQTLQRLQQALNQLVAACERGGPQGDCPILDALENHSLLEGQNNVA